MRPLTLFVLAEFFVIVLLAVFCLGGMTPAVDQLPTVLPIATGSANAADLAADALAAPMPAVPQRREVVADVPQIREGDPLGILVAGSVRGSDGALVAAANVTIRGDGKYFSGESATPGAYAIAGLQPGEWQITCRAEGFAAYEANCTLDSRAFQQIDLELQESYAVRVKIVASDGTSIMPELQQQSMFGLPYVVATKEPLTGDLPATEHSRVLRFGVGEWSSFYKRGRGGNPKLREQGYAGELLLNQRPPVYAALLLRTALLQSSRIEAGQHELVFTIESSDVLAKFGTVKLRLIDGTTGSPLAGVHVSVSTAQGGGFGGKAGDDGRVTMEHALPGFGSLQVRGGKGLESISRHVRVPTGGSVDLGDIIVTAAVKLVGVVLHADGKPGNAARVEWTELQRGSSPQLLVNRRSSSADADGKFELWRCGHRRYVVFARMQDGSFGHTTVDATGGVPAPITITLVRPTTVTLRADFPATEGYMVSALASDRTPVAVAQLGSSFRPHAMQLPPGSYTIEIHDLKTDLLARSFALTVGSVPLTIDVP